MSQVRKYTIGFGFDKIDGTIQTARDHPPLTDTKVHTFNVRIKDQSLVCAVSFKCLAS